VRLLAAGGAWDLLRAPNAAAARPDGAARTPADAVEVQVFGAYDPADPDEPARRACDRFARPDPFARDPDDPAVRALARLDAPVRADRARVLGERTFQLELARPRRAALAVEVTSLRDGAACDAALVRLLGFLAAQGALDRTLLVVRTRAATGGVAIARVPHGWRARAPPALVARFDERAPEFSRR
jgi:hypothetical protein